MNRWINRLFRPFYIATWELGTGNRNRRIKPIKATLTYLILAAHLVRWPLSVLATSNNIAHFTIR